MSEWIKTKEKIPVEGDNILLYVNDGRDKYITFGYIFSYDEEVFVFCTFGDEYIDESKVPYWMPLPEPPEKKRYILVSQGIKIAEFDNKEEAEAVVKKENEEFYKYQQECLDKGEPYADTEIFLYEEACGEIDESEGENEIQI